MYASWYRQKYPDKVLAIAQTSNEGLVTVDNSGTVRLWETGVANLAQSMDEWKKMVGGLDNRDLQIRRDGLTDLDSPKHGKILFSIQGSPYIFVTFPI